MGPGPVQGAMEIAQGALPALGLNAPPHSHRVLPITTAVHAWLAAALRHAAEQAEQDARVHSHLVARRPTGGAGTLPLGKPAQGTGRCRRAIASGTSTDPTMP